MLLVFRWGRFFLVGVNISSALGESLQGYVKTLLVAVIVAKGTTGLIGQACLVIAFVCTNITRSTFLVRVGDQLLALEAG